MNCWRWTALGVSAQFLMWHVPVYYAVIHSRCAKWRRLEFKSFREAQIIRKGKENATRKAYKLRLVMRQETQSSTRVLLLFHSSFRQVLYRICRLACRCSRKAYCITDLQRNIDVILEGFFSTLTQPSSCPANIDFVEMEIFFEISMKLNGAYFLRPQEKNTSGKVMLS